MSAPEPRSVLAAVMAPGRHGAGGPHPVLIRRRRMEVVQVTARRELVDACSGAAATVAGFRLLGPNRAVYGGETAAVWIQPRTWLIMRPWREEGALYRALLAACRANGAVVDQTGGKAVLRVSGRHGRAALEKGCRVDLHPRAFKPGSAAVTPIAHINVVLAQADDAPSYDLVLPSTFAETFLEWLEMSAAEFGYEIA
ncbi:MAG: sarcosine oxidase subunit gamma [Rhodospirillales bacterium]